MSRIKKLGYAIIVGIILIIAFFMNQSYAEVSHTASNNQSRLLGAMGQSLNTTSRERLEYYNGYPNNDVSSGKILMYQWGNNGYQDVYINTANATEPIVITGGSLTHLSHVLCLDKDATWNANRLYQVQAQYNRRSEENSADQVANKEGYIISHQKGTYDTWAENEQDAVQKAVWANWDPASGVSEDLEKEAAAFASYKANYRNPSFIQKVEEVTVAQDSYIIGPFSIDYTKKYVQIGSRQEVCFADMEGAYLKDQNGNDVKGWSFVTDKNGTPINNITRDGGGAYAYPDPGQEFYFKVPIVGNEGVTSINKVGFSFKNMEVKGDYYYVKDVEGGETNWQSIIVIIEGERYYLHKNLETETNIQLTFDVEGDVWVETADGKNSQIDGIMTGEEPRKEGIVTKLYKNGQTEPVMTTKTDGNGHYKFERIPRGGQYYVQFEYDGQKYMPTQYRAGEYDVSTGTSTYHAEKFKVNSKVAEDASVRDNFNKKFQTIAERGAIGENGETIELSYTSNPEKHTSTLNNNDQNPNFMITARTLKNGSEDIYLPIDTIAPYDAECLKHMNLGLVVRPQTDLQLQKYLNKAEVSINNKSAEYNYSDLYENGFNIDVRYSDAFLTRAQNQEIYKSDYAFRSQTRPELEVYVTYKIIVKNASARQTRVSEIVDFCDNEYIFDSSWVGKEAKKPLNWKDTSSYTYKDGTNRRNYDGYQAKYTDGLDLVLESGEEEEIYVKVKVAKDQDGYLMMDQDLNGNLLGGKKNIAEINAYSTTEGLIDRNSQPGNVIPEDIATYEDDNGVAKTINLIFKKEERVANGYVWDDTQKDADGNYQIADGVRQEGDQTIGNVKVEMFEILGKDENGNTLLSPATVYAGDKAVKTQEAVKTAEGENQGKYTITGFIPGDYIMRFTYGDGTQKYNAQDYKSTTYKTDGITDDDNKRFVEENGVKNLWSDARDNLETRQELNQSYAELTNSKAATLNGTTTIFADTKKIDVTVENPIDNTQNIDLGLEQRPQTKLTLHKDINSFKVTLSNGTVLIDSASGSNQNIVAPTGGNEILLHMDEELMQGATLEVRYGISASNNSETDYEVTGYDSTYYTGIPKGNKVTTEINEIIDYIDKELVFSQDGNNDWHLVEAGEIGALDLSSQVKEKLANDQEQRAITTTALSGQKLEPTQTTSQVEVKLSRVISPEKDDLTYDNIAEVTKVTNTAGRKDQTTTPGNYNPESGENANEADTAKAKTLKVTPPFGNNNYIYYILGFGLAIIIIGGIVYIKKRVIK